jgi:hypothetical protein
MFELTQRGRRAHLDGLAPESILMMEILRRIGEPMDEANVIDLTVNLIDRYGSPEDAITALKCGQVDFEKAE